MVNLTLFHVTIIKDPALRAIVAFIKILIFGMQEESSGMAFIKAAGFGVVGIGWWVHSGK